MEPNIHAGALETSEELTDLTQELLFRVQIMHTDSACAVVYMRRTFLQPDNAFLTKMYRFWEAAEPQLPPAPGWARIPSCLNNYQIITALTRTRRSLLWNDAGLLVRTDRDKGEAQMVYSWVATAAVFNRGVLFNLYLDLMEGRSGEMSGGKRYTEAAIALALCYIISKGILTLEINGVDWVDLTSVIMSRMRTAVAKAREEATDAEQRMYEIVWLWIYILGAQHEERVRTGLVRGSSETPNWFGRRMRHQGMQLHAECRLNIVSLFSDFVFIRSLEPGVEDWFKQCIA